MSHSPSAPLPPLSCSETKPELALFVGNDVADPALRAAVKRHLASCPECRGEYRQLKQVLSVLQHATPPETFEVRGSLWPAVSARLQQPAAPPHGFRRWWPATSLLAASLLLGTFLFWPAPPHNLPVGPATERSMFSFGLPAPKAAPEPALRLQQPMTPHAAAADAESRTRAEHADNMP